MNKLINSLFIFYVLLTILVGVYSCQKVETLNTRDFVH